MIINHRRNRFKGGNSKNYLKSLVAERDNIREFNNLELDHIVPFCISKNNKLTNLQLLSKEIHRQKSTADFKILKELRKEGYYEKITHYSVELLRPQKEVINRFIELRNKNNKKNR